MNRVIQDIFKDFNVNGVDIPVSFLRYNGDSETYITYMESDKDNSFSGDDNIVGYVVYYDFDIYSKSNYLEIMEQVKELLKANGWTWQPSRDSSDLYEDDTGYFHKTLCFAIEKEV
jgi:hypothetical protein|nr:MAG TPA: tail component [Caudoviricetes sp.]